MSEFDCEFDTAEPLPSFYRLAALESRGDCAHVGIMPAYKRDEFDVLAYAAPSCWFSGNNPGNDCGLRCEPTLKAMATHKDGCGRRIPNKIVIKCSVVSDEPDCLTFQGEVKSRIPPIVLTPFTAKGKNGPHRVEHKEISYNPVPLEYLKYASTTWHFEIERNGVENPSRQCPLRIAIPPEDGQKPSKLLADGIEPDQLAELDKDELTAIVKTRLAELAGRGFVLGFNEKEFSRKTKKVMALEIQLIRYFFLDNGRSLTELHHCRQSNSQPSAELVEVINSVFTSRKVAERFGIGSHNTVLRSQVFQYVTAQLLPNVDRSARRESTGLEVAFDDAAERANNERREASDNAEERQRLYGEIEGLDDLGHEEREGLLQMLRDGWDLDMVEQKLRDFQEE